jgi:hypothetical protein
MFFVLGFHLDWDGHFSSFFDFLEAEVFPQQFVAGSIWLGVEAASGVFANCFPLSASGWALGTVFPVFIISWANLLDNDDRIGTFLSDCTGLLL